jgi:A/G-specific adenine glycosylase
MWALAAELVPADAPGEFNQGLMDLGATICTPRAPTCLVCPLATACVARKGGRQDELPVARKRAATPRLEIRAAWIVKGGRWLLARRAPRGLFGGLWELPELDAVAGAERVDARPSAEHTHQLTHRTIHYRVYRAQLARGARLTVGAPYDDARFFTPSALASLGVSSATASLAARLSEQTPWPTPNARSRSSTKVTTRSSRA